MGGRSRDPALALGVSPPVDSAQQMMGIRWRRGTLGRPGPRGRIRPPARRGGDTLDAFAQEAVIERVLESAVVARPLHAAAALDARELADRRAVARALAGDSEAFGPVVRRHERGLVALCGRLSGDGRVGEELAQEAFARAFARLSTFRGECSFRHWLYRIAVNGCSDFQKAGGRAEESALLTGDELSAASDPERDAEAREELAALGRALATLAPPYRDAFTLFHLENRSYEEIAALTGVRVNALKVRVHRARLMLRSLLESA